MIPFPFSYNFLLLALLNIIYFGFWVFITAASPNPLSIKGFQYVQTQRVFHPFHHSHNQGAVQEDNPRNTLCNQLPTRRRETA